MSHGGSHFGPALTELRERQGVTESELAESVGVHRNTVTRWERGQTLPSADLVRAVCGYLGAGRRKLFAARARDLADRRGLEGS